MATERKRRGPGRPPKFGRPSRVVALTLPEDTIERLRDVHHDLGWAIVTLLDGRERRSGTASPGRRVPPDAELVAVSGRGSLIVVNQDLIRRLPGINIIPLSHNRAFLALDVNRGMSDLELAVGDRLAENDVQPRERRALANLQAQLRAWRKDPSLQFQTKAIVVVERTPLKRSDGTRRTESPMPSRRHARSAKATTDSTPMQDAAPHIH